MPTPTEAGRWRGWWEGVVDLVPVQRAGTREFSIDKLFSKALPQPFPEADRSILRLILPDSRLRVDRTPTATEGRWIDGRKREVWEWDLQGQELVGQDIKFWWDNEGIFQHRAWSRTLAIPNKLMPAKKLPQPPVTVARTVTSPHAGDGVFTITIVNAGNETRSAVYSEVWPWWVKGWLHEISVSQDGAIQRECASSYSADPSRAARRPVLQTVCTTGPVRYDTAPVALPPTSVPHRGEDPIHQTHAQIHGTPT